MARTATGVDIGLRTIKVLRGQYKGNTFHVSDFALAESNATVGDAEWVTDGWNALELDFKPTAARVGLTGHDVNIRYTRVPRVPDWQLRNLMRFEVSEIGDQSGSEVASDFNLLPELPEIEGEDVVLLAMAREGLLESHTEGLKAVGGTLDSFTPSAVALYNAFLRYGVVQEETVLLANIGHDNIDAVITRGPDLLFARNLSGGSRLFDDAIAQRFQVGAEQAEKIKREMASLRPGATHPTPNHERASRAILTAAGQLLSLLQSTVLFCKSQVKISGLKIDRVLLCGGGAALDGLPQYLAAGMNVPVELFDPFRVVEVGGLDPAQAELLEEYKLEAVVALGLATMGSDPASYSIEILPEAVARSRAFFGGTAWLIAAAVLAMAFLGFKALSYSDQLDDVVLENRGLASKVDRANRTHNEAVRLVEENAVLRELVLELQATGGTGEQAARMVEFLDGALPGTFWISRFSSDWSFDPELGILRTEPKPILSVRGHITEGTASRTELFTRMMRELDTSLEGVSYHPVIDQDVFTIDLSLFSPSEDSQPATEVQ